MDEMTDEIYNWAPDLLEETTDDVYSWAPNIFQIVDPIDPEEKNYIGNVIGNRSKEDQIVIVTEAGTTQKEAILEESQQLISEINESAKNLLDIMAISSDTMNEIMLFFGGTFVLDTSVLDSTPLG